MHYHTRTRTVRASLILPLAALLAACTPDSPVKPEAPQDQSQATNANSTHWSRRVKMLDDEYVEMSKDIPGFAGLYREPTGTMTVMLTNTAVLPQARTRLQKFLVRNLDAGSQERLVARVPSFQARQAKYDFKTLSQWHRGSIVPEVNRLAGVTMSGIDHKLNRVLIGVSSDAVIPAVKSTLQALRIPLDAVQIVPFGGMNPVSRRIAAPLPSTLQSRFSPSPGGVLIGIPISGTDSVSQCTLGFNVVNRISGVVQPDRYLISAGHCTETHGAIDAAAVSQGGLSDDYALEIVDPPYFTNAENPSCPVGVHCWIVDVFLARWANPGWAEHGYVASTELNSLTVDGRFMITGVEAANTGDFVRKVGATTGTTGGFIRLPCVYVAYTVSGEANLCLGVATNASLNGDSGGPIIKPSSTAYRATAIGIVSGHGSYNGENVVFFSPMNVIASTLSSASGGTYTVDPTTLDPIPPPPPTVYTAAITGPTSVKKNDNACIWRVTTNIPNPVYQWWVNGTIDAGHGNLTSWYQSTIGNFKLTVDVRSSSGSMTAVGNRNVTVSTSASVCFP